MRIVGSYRYTPIPVKVRVGSYARSALSAGVTARWRQQAGGEAPTAEQVQFAATASCVRPQPKRRAPGHSPKRKRSNAPRNCATSARLLHDRSNCCSSNSRDRSGAALASCRRLSYHSPSRLRRHHVRAIFGLAHCSAQDRLVTPLPLSTNGAARRPLPPHRRRLPRAPPPHA